MYRCRLKNDFRVMNAVATLTRLTPKRRFPKNDELIDQLKNAASYNFCFTKYFSDIRVVPDRGQVAEAMRGFVKEAVAYFKDNYEEVC